MGLSVAMNYRRRKTAIGGYLIACGIDTLQDSLENDVRTLLTTLSRDENPAIQSAIELPLDNIAQKSQPLCFVDQLFLWV